MLTALRVFLPFAFAYLLAYLLRVVNAVAGAPLSEELALSASALGLLTSVYFFGFALCQVPLGVVMDRYGARRVEGSLLVLAAAGCGLFAVASDYGELVTGRILMGVGASMCLMAPFTAYRRWFPPERLPLVVGLHMTFGAAGSALGGGPAEAVIAAFDWRTLFLMLGALVLVASMMILFVVPKRNEPGDDVRVRILVRELGRIVASRALWRVAPLSATVQAGFLGVMSLWTGPWLRQVADLSPARAALWLSIASAGLMIGFLAFGFIASWAQKRDRSMHVFVLGALSYSAVMFGIIVLPPDVATPLWLLFSITGSVGILSYALVNQAFPASMAGRVNTALNGLVFFFAFVVQWLFGIVLEFFPDGAGGATRQGYQVGLGLLLAAQLLAFLPVALMARRSRRGGDQASPQSPPGASRTASASATASVAAARSDSATHSSPPASTPSPMVGGPTP